MNWNAQADTETGYLYAIARNINEQVKLENEKESLIQKLSDMTNALDVSTIVAYTDNKGILIHVNDMFCKISGYSKEELIGQNQSIVNSGYHLNSFWKEMWRTIGYGDVWNGKIRNKAKDGSIYWVYTTIIPFLKNGKPYKYISIRNDITELVETEELILKNTTNALEEKDVLLKEIHHRVKNNLQVITSLLSLQSSFIDDQKVKGLFRYSQYRINSMAMVHEMLYGSENLSRINYRDYLEVLATKLIGSFKGASNNIRLRLDAREINLNIDTAIPLGLCMNEIITNALKYGIVDDSSGCIYIELKQLAYPNFMLKIGDNGIGFDKAIDFRNTNSLGLKLMHKLALQLRGNIEKDNSKKGTHYLITFQEIEQTS